MKIGIAGVPISPGEFSLQLRRPGRVCAVGFRVDKRLVMTAGEPEFEERPVMFVEADPDGPLRNRKFALVPTDAPFAVKEGYKASWVATGMSSNTGVVMHLFEIVEVS